MLRSDMRVITSNTPLREPPTIYIIPRSELCRPADRQPYALGLSCRGKRQILCEGCTKRRNMLTINSEMHGKIPVIAVNGRVDGFSAPQLESALQDALRAKHYKAVVDLAGTEFLSSAGMRALLKARMEMQDKNGELRLAGPSPFILDSLKLVGLDKLFKIYDTRQAALTGF